MESEVYFRSFPIGTLFENVTIKNLIVDRYNLAR